MGVTNAAGRCGGSGIDYQHGENGSDRLYGGAGNDRLPADSYYYGYWYDRDVATDFSSGDQWYRV